jgi:hypothetical protein
MVESNSGLSETSRGNLSMAEAEVRRISDIARAAMKQFHTQEAAIETDIAGLLTSVLELHSAKLKSCGSTTFPKAEAFWHSSARNCTRRRVNHNVLNRLQWLHNCIPASSNRLRQANVPDQPLPRKWFAPSSTSGASIGSPTNSRVFGLRLQLVSQDSQPRRKKIE